MVWLQNDSRAGISQIARSFVQKKGVKGNAVELLLEQARSYLRGEVPAGGFSDVVWRLVDDKLVATDVPAMLYSAELAKSCAADAVAIAPQEPAAVSMLAQANLAQVNLITTSLAQGDESLRALEPMAAELKIAALATGLPALRSALDAGIAQGLAPLAVGAIDALATAESADTIGSSSLRAALHSTDKRVSYAAATALVRATGGVNVPNADQVVAELAKAVAEESVRTIHVIDPTKDTAAAVAASSGVRGNAVDASTSATAGMGALLNNPNVDVLVINENLPDGLPETVIGNVRKDTRMTNTKIVVIAKDVEAAKTRFGDSVQGVVQAPLSGEALVAEVNRVLEGSTNPSGARAEGFATNASEALLAIAARKGNIAGALDNLALQLNRSDAVAVPAAKALGMGGSVAQLDALTKAMQDGSAEVKKAAAAAIGHVLARTDSCPPNVADALKAVLASDAEVGLRTAAAIALGNAKLDAKQAGDVQMKLRKIAGSQKTDG